MQSSLFFSANFPSVPDDKIISELKNNFAIEYGSRPEIEQEMSWRGSLNAMKNFVSESTAVFMELKFPIGLERADYLLLRHGRALVVEAKGWKTYRKLDEFSVSGDSSTHIDPCYQVENYVSKLRNFHTASRTIDFDGVVYMYHTTNGDKCKVIYNGKDLQSELQLLPKQAATENDINAIEEGSFETGRRLIDYVQANIGKILQDASMAFLNAGFGLSEEQMKILSQVMNDLARQEQLVFLVSGGMGSGKTLVALALLFESIKRGYGALLAYRNNRLINTLRQVLGPRFAPLLQYYSTGSMANFRGIGERNFDPGKLKNISLIIYDEAQRMTMDVIATTMERPLTSVYFYDEDQILLGDESGTSATFSELARKMGRRVVEIHLDGFYRVLGGRDYDLFLNSIFYGNIAMKPLQYDFRLFSNIREMLRTMEERKTGPDSVRPPKLALLASFTKSDGRKEKRRVFDPEILWLMDEKTEYPAYWTGKKDPLQYCASIYGSQGFESDYVGLIWGEDLVWRGSWTIQPDKIMDGIGGNNSLKKLAITAPERARSMLINRYRIMLSRGMEGTYVYCEDGATLDHLRSILSETPRISKN